MTSSAALMVESMWPGIAPVLSVAGPLVSGFFSSCLPRIHRVLDVPVPHLDEDGKLDYPNPGYDERFGTWLNPNAPQIRSMGHGEALRWLLHDLFGRPDNGGFWWYDEQARVHARARFVTPFCRA